MFGPAFLVAPVTEQGATSRKVYLPAGADWYDYWTNQRYAGGQTIDGRRADRPHPAVRPRRIDRADGRAGAEHRDAADARERSASIPAATPASRCTTTTA